ncbi:M15 family metallopeptidase [Streptomyces sp. NPDC058657]|uniref:M15 family metallopeptidase n=1 Tax=unclassified Streptomyces TaxID=2593676 RepID=UPI003656D450
MREAKRSRTWWAAGGLAMAGAVGVASAAVLADDPGRYPAARVTTAPEFPQPGKPSPQGGGKNADGAADAGDGAIPAARTLTPFDTGHSALRNLDPALLKAVQRAATDAKRAGIDLYVTAGWRSKDYQQELLDRAVDRYGSLERARQFVQTPEKSEHPRGRAVDIGPANADDWLIRKGAAYGLCQVYANERWHFELLTAPGGTCPALKRDASG